MWPIVFAKEVGTWQDVKFGKGVSLLLLLLLLLVLDISIIAKVQYRCVEKIFTFAICPKTFSSFHKENNIGRGPLFILCFLYSISIYTQLVEHWAKSRASL
jgi:hypothetical protein